MGQGSAYMWHLKVLSAELVCRMAAEPQLPVCTVPQEDLLLCRVEKMVVKTLGSSGSSSWAPEATTEPEKHEA